MKGDRQLGKVRAPSLSKNAQTHRMPFHRPSLRVLRFLPFGHRFIFYVFIFISFFLIDLVIWARLVICDIYLFGELPLDTGQLALDFRLRRRGGVLLIKEP